MGAHVCLLNEQMNLQFTKYFLTMNPPAPHHSKQGGTHISIVQRRNVAKATALKTFLPCARLQDVSHHLLNFSRLLLHSTL